MTEAELFAAYRVSAGYAAQCSCGTWITAPSTATTKDIAKTIRVHNASTEHQQSWAEQEAVNALQAPKHVCICHGARPTWDNGHAGTSSTRVDSPTDAVALLVPGATASSRYKGRD